MMFNILDLKTGKWRPTAAGSYNESEDSLTLPLTMLEPHCVYNASFPAPPYKLEGTVLNPGGRPLVGRTVTATSIKKAQAYNVFWSGSGPYQFDGYVWANGGTETATTGSNGRFSFSPINAYILETDLTVSVPAGMRLLNPPGRKQYSDGATLQLIDYQGNSRGTYTQPASPVATMNTCWEPGQKCASGDKCCDGKSCSDGFCN
jgi:hypothetical protein